MNWLAVTPAADVFISAVTIGELQRGAERIRVIDPAKALRLDDWIDLLVSQHNLLAFDTAPAREWARLVPKRTEPDLENAMIAAMARVHRLTLVTRNVKDFQSFGVTILNPFE